MFIPKIISFLYTINNENSSILFQIRDEFEETVEMSTYLVAFVVCDFAKISDVSQNKVNVSVIASKDKISQAEFALTSATKLMDYYADFFGIPYPLQKQGNITV